MGLSSKQKQAILEIFAYVKRTVVRQLDEYLVLLEEHVEKNGDENLHDQVIEYITEACEVPLDYDFDVEEGVLDPKLRDILEAAHKTLGYETYEETRARIQAEAKEK